MNLNKYISEKTIIFILLSCALIVYAQHSWVEGFFLDGYLYSALGKHAAEKGTWLVPYLSETNWPKFDQHPPFIFMLMGIFFKIFGAGFTTSRVFGLSWAIISIALYSFFIMKILKNNPKKNGMALFTGIIFILIPSLIKKSRFPAMDTPLMFAFILTYLSFFRAYKLRIKDKDHFKDWILVGLFFGISLLIKGPPGLIIILGFLIFTTITHSTKKVFLSPLPWAGLCFGFMIFSIWPLLLYYHGDIQVFYSYLDNQLWRTIVDGRDRNNFNLFLYFNHLLKTCFPWIIISIYGGIKYWKNKFRYDNEKLLYLLSVSWFFSVLIPFSFMKFKYSHYIIPLYPPLAYLTASGIMFFKENFQNKLINSFLVLFFIANFALLIFPLGTTSSRSSDLFNVKKISELQNIDVAHDWVIVDDAYSFRELRNWVGFVYSSNMRRIEKEQFLNEITQNSVKTIYVIKSSLTESLERENMLSNFKKLYSSAQNKIDFFIGPK